jgi:FKBP-type peptidyl-prolyl cis-trans isomerase
MGQWSLLSAGWDEGVTTMKVGEKATLDISRYVSTV